MQGGVGEPLLVGGTLKVIGCGSSFAGGGLSRRRSVGVIYRLRRVRLHYILIQWLT